MSCLDRAERHELPQQKVWNVVEFRLIFILLIYLRPIAMKKLLSIKLYISCN